MMIRANPLIKMTLHGVETKLATAWPPQAWQDITVLVAVSGGADSVALLRALAALKTAGEGRLVVAHANHQLRGDESDADAAFVAGLSQSLGLDCTVGRIEVERASEAGARRARYAFLQQTAARLGARYVVTAHTADDQAETILHRILRGTGIRGLAGMSRARPLGPVTLLRPLLGIRRTELAAYLVERGQAFRHDATNLETRFTRNRIRRELLPQLAQNYNAGIVDALLRLGTLAAESQSVVDALADALIDRAVHCSGQEACRIDRDGLAGQPRHVVRELLAALWRRQGWPMQAMGFEQWELLADMLLATGPERIKRVFPGNVAAETIGGQMSLRRGDC
jgi:tRNA(Ile)-lysidine synthase